MPMRLLFLRGNGYLFDSGKGIYWTNHLDKFIANLIRGSTSEPKIDNLLRISIINSAAFLYYRDNVGKYCIRHNLWTSYPQLAKWIEANGAQVGVQREEYNVSLGLDGQFLALSSLGHKWNAISREFHEHIQKMLTDGGVWKEDWEPSGALFGVHNSYVITCKGGRHVAFSTNLREHYPGLEQRFQERFHPNHGVGPKYDYITLNPYVTNEWVVVWADDTVSWSLSPSVIEILGPVTTWLSHKTSLYTSIPSASASASTAPATSTPQAPPFHHANTTPAANIDQTASFKPNPPSRPLSTASNNSATRPSASAYQAPYTNATPPSHTYSNPSYRPSATPTYLVSPYPANTSSIRPHLHGPSHSAPTLQRPTMWTHANDTSTTEMLHFLHACGKQMNQFSNSGFGGGSGGDPTGGLLSGGDPTGGMLSGGDPTGGMLSGGLLSGGDPTGGILSGGMGMGMMGGMGMDPSSMLMGNQCSVM